MRTTERRKQTLKAQLAQRIGTDDETDKDEQTCRTDTIDIATEDRLHLDADLQTDTNEEAREYRWISTQHTQEPIHSA